MKFVKGNILDAGYGIIAHQVNCQMVMGSGLAKQIKDKYPSVYNGYMSSGSLMAPNDRLGKCIMTEAVYKKLYVANIFGQYHYLPRGIVHTDYTALGMGLRSLNKWRSENAVGVPIYIPHGIGCGLGGGDWNIVSGIIRDSISDAIIVRKDG